MLINFFNKKHPKKPTATFPPINSTPPMARLTVKLTKPTTKQQQGQMANNANKQARNQVLDVCDI